jgi:PTS system cellobiose-specific IIA component
MDDLDTVVFQLISYFGSSRSYFLEALQKANQKDYAGAEALLALGEADLLAGHHTHAQLITQEASGQPVQVSLLLMHAEDQFMAAETTKTLVLSLIEHLKSHH